MWAAMTGPPLSGAPLPHTGQPLSGLRPPLTSPTGIPGHGQVTGAAAGTAGTGLGCAW